MPTTAHQSQYTVPDGFAQTLTDNRIFVSTVYLNPPPGFLYEMAIKELYSGRRCAIASNGALIAYSGAKTGRSPKDKRLVEEPGSKDDIHWGKINMPLSQEAFQRNLDMAIGFLNGRPSLFVIDGFAGWAPKERIKVRIICARPYHALFMTNMLIRPTAEELQSFGKPDWVIYNAGQCPADSHIEGVTSHASVDLNFKTQQMVILGTEYAGCMKKGVFTILNYLLPKQGILSMHCAANEGADGDVALFFGLSGTGKTTLSADPNRRLIGDDEHGWGDDGVFNFEGGCYAKTINLSEEKEPDIYRAIRFGTVLENVVFDPLSHVVDYDDASITENTRASYPIEFIENAKIPCVGTHPKNIVFLTCDAYGVLPPISKLTPEQAMYHFISGYTAKVAGTEVGVTEPQATFSACFGEAFMVWHPTKYAQLLKEKMEQHGVSAWLVNTGWSGGPYGVGQRMKLSYTRQMITAALSGALKKFPFETDPVFGLSYPTHCPNVPRELLNPKATWSDPQAYDETAQKLARLFVANFDQFRSEADAALLSAEPKLEPVAR